MNPVTRHTIASAPFLTSQKPKTLKIIDLFQALKRNPSPEIPFDIKIAF